MGGLSFDGNCSDFVSDCFCLLGRILPDNLGPVRVGSVLSDFILSQFFTFRVGLESSEALSWS